MKINLALDSGAFGLRTKFSKGKGPGGADDFTYYNSAHFDNFKEKYIAWLVEYSQYLDFCVTLDVIYKPELSFSIWSELQKALGASSAIPLLPVVHFGTEPSWVKKYLDVGVSYIGLGGVGGGSVSYKQYYPWVMSMFKVIPKDVRVHGFAVTKPLMALNAPWFSVDSASPCWWSSYGFVRFRQGKNLHQFDFCRRVSASSHFENQGTSYKKGVEKILEGLNLGVKDLGDTGQDGYLYRTLVNYVELSRLLLDHGVKYYLAGSLSGGVHVNRFLPLLEKTKLEVFRYLGSFFTLSDIKKILTYQGLYNEHVSQTTSTETRKSSSTQPRLRSRTKAPLLRSRPRVRFQ